MNFKTIILVYFLFPLFCFGQKNVDVETIQTFRKKVEKNFRANGDRKVTSGQNAELAKWVDEKVQEAPDTYTAKLLQFELAFLEGDFNFKDLQEIHSLAESIHFHLHHFIRFYEWMDNKNLIKKYALLLQKYGPFDSGILEYHNNVLQSCPPSAVLFSFGYTDTYALRILQSVKGIRTDVKVVSVDDLKNKTHQKNVAGLLGLTVNPSIHSNPLRGVVNWATSTSKTVCFTLTFPPSFFKALGMDRIYCSGLVYQYSKNKKQNIDELVKHWGVFNLEYFTQRTSSEQVKLNQNYFIPLFTWYRSLDSGNKLRKTLEFRIKELSKFTGKEKEVEKLIMQ